VSVRTDANHSAEVQVNVSAVLVSLSLEEFEVE